MKKVNSILLIDDNAAENYYNKYIINELGFCNQIKVAGNGIEALEYLQKTTEQIGLFPRPDLIFLDINMPRMDGFEFLEEYKKLDWKFKSKIVIVMLVTSLNPEDRAKALQNEEVREYLNKPLTPEHIHQLLTKHFYN